MKNSYQRHAAADKRFLAKKLRREKIRLLIPLLSMLCFFIGFCLLALGLALFSYTMPMHWLQFSMLYLLAGTVFLLLTLWGRGREQALQRRR